MTAPRLVVDLAALEHNARALVARLAPFGIEITAVTKSFLGSPVMARALLAGGVRSLGDSRVENIIRLREAGIECPMTLIRSPMISQVDDVVRWVDTSLVTEVAVVEALSASAIRQGRQHRVIVMIELGDLREGVMPKDLSSMAHLIRSLGGLDLAGVGTNLACQSGVVPDEQNMDELSRIVASLETELDLKLEVISGGNSANLDWLEAGVGAGLGAGRVNSLRLGEAVLLGCEPLHRRALPGLRTDVVTLVGEVIESKVKPRQPWGSQAQGAFGEPEAVSGQGDMRRTIVALGRQDVDPDGLKPHAGVHVLGSSSDHLVLEVSDTAEARGEVGSEISFGLDYSAVLRAMTSPFVSTEFRRR